MRRDNPGVVSKLNAMIEHIIDIEGGYVNHPNDRGGPTRYGVTQETLSQWRGYWVTAEEVAALDKEEARNIYKYKYFLNPKIDQLPGPIQLQTFDCSINHGPSRAIKFIQKVCKAHNIAYLKIDGINGPRTRLAADKAQKKMGIGFNNAIVEERLRFYYWIVDNDPSQEVFLDGWISRAEGFRR